MAGETSAGLLRAAMDAQGVSDNETRAGLAAICMGESNMLTHVETGYANTSDARIRQVFGSRVSNLSDAELDALKADDRKWFGYVYGSQFSVGQQLGNTQPDDGYNFRGRGFIQLTGRANYQRYATKIGRPEIMANPDLANDPAIASQLAVAYILDRYHGGGFEAMMASVGNNTPDIATTKRQYFQKFMADGEFAAVAGTATV
jgi:predicted chitinase